MKKFLIIFFILLIGLFVFFSLFKTEKDFVSICYSSWRGKNIVLGDKWVFYPERIIPKFFSLEKIPNPLIFYKNWQFTLPYVGFLEYGNFFQMEIYFKIYFFFQEKNINFLYQKNIETIEKDLFTEIQGIVLKTIAQNSENPHFTQKDFVNILQEEWKKKELVIEIEVPVFPVWKKYVETRKKMEERLSIASDAILDQLLANQIQILRNNAENKTIEEYVRLLLQLSKQIGDSPYKDLVLLLLEKKLRHKP